MGNWERERAELVNWERERVECGRETFRYYNARKNALEA